VLSKSYLSILYGRSGTASILDFLINSTVLSELISGFSHAEDMRSPSY